MPNSDFASFLMGECSQPVTEKELRDAAQRLADALEKRGFDVSDVFGSSTDLWGFGVDTEVCEILVDVSPPEVTVDKRWGLQVLLNDAGWFKETRERRLGEMKRVEWAAHEALADDLRATDVVWLLGPGRVSRRTKQKTP